MNVPPASADVISKSDERANRFFRWAAVLMGLAVVLLRVALARPSRFCGTPDACFYLGLGQNLAAGQGFHARFLYDFQQAHPTLPNTGLEYWRPGVSLLLQLTRPFGGVSLQSSILLTILVGVGFAAAAWHVAVTQFRDRRLAFAAFALCLLSSPAWIGSLSPDSGLYYGAAVAWFLALFTVKRQGGLQDALALACVSLAYAIRNDAAMLLLPLLAVLWARRRRAAHDGKGSKGTGSSAVYAVLILCGFLAALAPMHLLYKAVLGTAFPAGSAQAFYLSDLSDFGRYRDPVSLHRLLAHGAKQLITLRVATLATVVYRIGALMIGYPALIFLPALLPFNGRNNIERGFDQHQQPLPELLGPGVFAAAALFAYTMVLPVVGAFSALRTAVGLMPLASVLVVLAIGRAARTVRLAAWLTGGVVLAGAVAGIMEIRRDVPAANEIGAADRAEAAQLAALGAKPAQAVVLTGDPVQFSVTTGYATIALPSNGLDAIAAAARDFHATHVILDSANLPAATDALQQQLHPLRSVTLVKEHSLILELPREFSGP